MCVCNLDAFAVFAVDIAQCRQRVQIYIMMQNPMQVRPLISIACVVAIVFVVAADVAKDK